MGGEWVGRGWMDVWVGGWMDVLVGGWMDEQMDDKWVGGWISKW